MRSMQPCSVLSLRSCGDERRGERDARLAGCGHDRHAQGFTGLSALVQNALASNPFCGHVFVFRGRRGDLLKLLWWDGTGLCLMAKRLERGRFIWPQAQNGSVSLSAAQLSMLLEGIDWRHPVRTADPLMEM
jgi:transposase